ncbi:MAG: endonuclease/exonuclease/phosphatase family protein [Geminicoccaceae bacterium]|nr:endonuclease/exonuclease/phosphatase family protein [Geminicoccaceae bacterium]
MRVVTYNIHRGAGLWRRRNLDRVAAVVRTLDADIVALQEIEVRPGTPSGDQVRHLADTLGMHAVEGPAMRDEHGTYGNAVLSRLPVENSRSSLFIIEGGEPRSIVEMDVGWGSGPPLRVLATHLDLQRAARARQLEEVIDFIGACDEAPLVLMGDLNEWWPWSGGMARLGECLELLAPAATFPSFLPCLALDRIALRGCRAVSPPRAYREGAARHASDHLPLYVDIVAGPPVT